MHTPPKGFSLPLLIAIIAFVGVVGIVAWRFYAGSSQQNQTATTNQSPSQQEQPVADPHAGYVVIGEWNVRFKPTGNLADVKYKVSTDTAVFSTAALAKYGASCDTGTDSLSPLGRLTRTTAEQQAFTSESGAFVKKIGDYYYRYTTPQAACSDDTTASTLQTQTTAIFKTSIATLEATK